MRLERTARRLAAVAAVTTLCLLLTACGGGGDGAGAASVPPGDTSPVVGDVEGFVFSPSGRQSGLFVGTTATAPAGQAALLGATVTTAKSAVSDTTDATGHFLLKGVRAGLDELIITPPGGGETRRPLTVLGGATINVGTPSVDQATALEAVRQAVGAVALPDGTPVALDDVVILGPSHPLPAGVKVQSTLDIGVTGAEAPFEVPAPQWFFYVDYRPGARFGHTVGFYFIDAETAAQVVRAANGWPAINDLMYYGNDDVNRTSPDLLHGAGYTNGLSAPSQTREIAPAPPAITSRPSLTRNPDPECVDNKTVGVVIRGDYRRDFSEDSRKMSAFLADCLKAQVFNYGPPAIGQPAVDGKAEVKARFQEACKLAGPCDTLYVSLHTHGLEDGTQKLVQGGTWDGQQVNENVTNFDLTTDLPWAECKAGCIVIQTDSCFAGQTSQNMQQYISQHPEIFQGRTVTILGSSAADEVSYGGQKGSPPGGYFTNAFVNAAQRLGCSEQPTEAELHALFDDAAAVTLQNTTGLVTAWGTKGKMGQRASVYHRPLQPGEMLDSEGHLILTVASVVIPANLDTFGISAADFPLGWIQNGRVVGSHPPVCSLIHLHSTSQAGITIVIPAGATLKNADDQTLTFPNGATIGPIPDPDQDGCGYGPVFPKRFD